MLSMKMKRGWVAMAVTLLAVMMTTGAPVVAGDGNGSTATVHAPIIRPVAGAAAHDLEFVARFGPGSVTGHLYIRTHAIMPSGQRRLTSLFGFYPASGEADLSTVAGVVGKVGYIGLDLRQRPTAVFRRRISGESHARVLQLAQRLVHAERYFDLFDHNCNYLAARVARAIGLAAPSHYGQLPVDYVQAMAQMNRAR